MDTDGYLYVVDRIKGMIVTGDENVYSTEVENAVAQHPAVANYTVVEVPDEQWANGSALLHYAKLRQVEALIFVGQIARASSLKAAATRRVTGCSMPSS